MVVSKNSSDTGFPMKTINCILFSISRELVFLFRFYCILACYISYTLRSLVPEIVSYYKTVSPWLGDNCVSKCRSDSFPHTKYTSSCVETLRNTLWCFFLFSNPGEKVWKVRKTMRQICPTVFLHFMTFSSTIGNQRCFAP